MFGRCLFVCFQSRWSQVRERNISEAVLSLKLFYPVSNVCSSKCLNFFAAAKTYPTFLRYKVRRFEERTKLFSEAFRIK